jgi:hypothetical protein
MKNSTGPIKTSLRVETGEKMEYLFELINNSKISLLGYTFKEERIKDELISRVPHIELQEVSSSFSMLSYIRDSKIDTLLNNKENINHFLFDINNFRVGTNGQISRSNMIQNTLKRIQKELFDTNFKLLITCPIYTQMGNDEYNFSSGQTGLYIADFVGIIKQDSIKIMKNRYGSQTSIEYDSK